MEITRDNAESVIPVVESRLRECDYFSIDLEFSGIDRNTDAETFKSRVKSLQQLPSEGYARKRATLKAYTVMQIGISTFKLRDDDDTAKKPVFDIVLRETKTQRSLDDLTGFFADRESDPEKTISMCNMLSATWMKLLRSSQSASRVMLAKQLASIESAATSACKETREECEKADPISRLGILLLRKREFFARWSALAGVWRAYLAKSENHAMLDGTNCVRSHYSCDSFFAYLFPAPQAPFENVSINTETVGTFLASNHMDFNQWICKGLRFTTLADYVKARADAIDNLVASADLSPYTAVCGVGIEALAPLSGAEMAYIKWAFQIVDSDEFRSARTHLLTNAEATIRFARSTAQASPPAVSSFVPQSLNYAHGQALRGLGLTKRGGRYERLDTPVVPAAASSEPSKTAETKIARVGITANHGGSALLFALVAAASTAKKPMVVHNGYTDLMMLMYMLLGDLPATLDEFKAVTNTYFPALYDTRTLSSVPAIQDMGNFKGPLEQTYKILLGLNTQGFASANPAGPTTGAAFAPWDARESAGAGDAADVLSTLSAHNAGYDAFITGCVFAMLTSAFVGRKVSASTYKSVVPVYGALYLIAMRSKAAGVYVLPKGNPMYLLDVPKGFHTIERVREFMEDRTDGKVTVCVSFVGDNCYAVEVAHMPPKHDMDATMTKVCLSLTEQNKATATMQKIDLSAPGAAVQAI